MNEFREHLIDRRDQALHAAGDARGHLIRLLEECEDNKLANAMAHVARLQPYARWCPGLT